MYYDVTQDDSDNDESKPDGTAKKGSAKRRARRNAPKEKVLHTRVPAVLEEELKRLATNLRVPVSNVVRAILEDAVDAVDTVTEAAEGELMGFVDRLARQRGHLRDRIKPKAPPEPTADKNADKNADKTTGEAADGTVAEQRAADESPCPADPGDLLEGAFGFQPLTLAADVPCTGCGRVLAAGTSANRALFDDPQKRVFLGPNCRLMPTKGETS